MYSSFSGIPKEFRVQDLVKQSLNSFIKFSFAKKWSILLDFDFHGPDIVLLPNKFYFILNFYSLVSERSCTFLNKQCSFLGWRQT